MKGTSHCHREHVWKREWVVRQKEGHSRVSKPGE